MAFQFKFRKLCHRLLEIIRELFIGKMAAVVVAWVLKNAVFWTIIIGKARLLGKDPATLLEPAYASRHGLEFLVYSFVTFFFLLLFASFLAYMVSSSGWSGFLGTSSMADVEEVVGVARSITAGWLDAAESAAVAAEMSNFYAAGLVFIPAWAYKAFVDKSLEYVTMYYDKIVIETVENTTASVVNKTETVAESFGLEPVINAGFNVISTGVSTISNLTGGGGNANDTVIDEDGNETNASAPEIVVKTQEVFTELIRPTAWWNVMCFLCATCVAATIQVVARAAVDTLQGGRWDYLKQVFKSLETCMGLGTGSAFWKVFVIIFEDSPFSWHLRTFYTVFITVVIVATQIVIRKWLARKPNLNMCVAGSVRFIDKAYDFVIAWAWEAWLTDTFKPCIDLVLGNQDDECDPLHKTHFFCRACLITFLCIAVNAILDIFKMTLNVTPEIRQTALMVTGVNAGWAWMFFAKSWFGCGSTTQFDLLSIWGWTVVVIVGTLVCAASLDYVDHKAEKYVLELRRQAGTLNEKDDDTYWRQYDSSEGSDSDDEDVNSDDDSEDHEKPVATTSSARMLVLGSRSGAPSPARPTR